MATEVHEEVEGLAISVHPVTTELESAVKRLVIAISRPKGSASFEKTITEDSVGFGTIVQADVIHDCFYANYKNHIKVECSQCYLNPP